MKIRTFIIGIAVSLSLLGASCESHQASEQKGNGSHSVASASDDRRSEAHSSAAEPQESMVINIENYAFGPNEITVPAGTKVTWVNKDKVPHTATADDKAFDSGILTQRNEFSFTFSTPGTYAYHCIPHPAMRGKVTVK